MILVLRPNCSDADVQSVVDRLRELGALGRVMKSADRTLVAVENGVWIEPDAFNADALVGDPYVDLVVPTVPPQPACGGVDVPHTGGTARGTREVCLGPAKAIVGGQRLGIIAGPCSVEDRQQLLEVAHAVKEAGAIGLRGGAFKPRTNPYSFQGLGEPALELLAEAREATGLAVVTEVMSVEQTDLVARYADVLQIGARNMHNSSLLAAAGKTGKPILLKRGWSATLQEMLQAAEYITREGDSDVILCERGIRTFESYVRHTLALAIVPAVKQRSPLPIIVDPSHGTGVADWVPPLSKAAIACGADGLLIEVHPHPEKAQTDGEQSLNIPQFQRLMSDLQTLAPAVGRAL
ncbi:MAG: 3-deoxy-7-phosphoheptulonate synthase [Planctomycetota bacterium]|nr:3-deoxy-7-phosphoheptulonate synthase [Planctomycetota bacterium]